MESGKYLRESDSELYKVPIKTTAGSDGQIYPHITFTTGWHDCRGGGATVGELQSLI